MRYRQLFTLVILVAGLGAGLTAWALTEQNAKPQQGPARSTGLPADSVEIVDVQEGAGPLMEAKLEHAQAVLAGIAMEDYPKIQKNAHALAALSQAAAWQVYQTEEYKQFSAQFQRAADSMARNARRKNVEATALDYVQLTMTCVNCHKYVRNVRLSQLPAEFADPTAQLGSLQGLPNRD